MGAAFGNIWEAWYLIDQTPSSPSQRCGVFIKAAITTGGLPTALRLRGRFHKSLCEASRVHVRGSTCLSPVTRTHRVNCFLGDKHGSDDSWVFRVRGRLLCHVSAGCCGVMSCHAKDYHWMNRPPAKRLRETEIPTFAERINSNPDVDFLIKLD